MLTCVVAGRKYLYCSKMALNSLHILLHSNKDIKQPGDAEQYKDTVYIYR